MAKKKSKVQYIAPQQRSTFHSTSEFLYRDNFDRLIPLIPADEKDKITQLLDDEYVKLAMQHDGLNLAPKYTSLNVKTRSIFREILRNPAGVAGQVLSPLFETAREVLSEEQFSDPSESDFDLAHAHVLKNWGNECVHAWLITVASMDMPASPFANNKILADPYIFPQITAESLQEDLQKQSEVLSEDLDSTLETPTEISVPEEELYTPLTQALIRLAIQTAAGDEGAPNKQDFEAMLTELITANSSKLNFWFIAGFAAGLDLVDPEEILNSAALNEDRGAWHLSGYLKGLLRRKATTADEIEKTLIRRRSDFRKLITTHIGIDIANLILPFAIKVDHTLVTEMVELLPLSHPRNVNTEIYFIGEIDTATVALLRNNQVQEAAQVLMAAIERFELVKRHHISSSEKVSNRFIDLRTRLSIGLAASHRLNRNFPAAKSELERITKNELDQVSERTRARYSLQYALAASKTLNISDVKLPRNETEKREYQHKFESVESHLVEAISIHPKPGESQYYTKSDALFLLSGLDIVAGNLQTAQLHLNELIPMYEVRSERKYLVPQIKLMQALIDFESDGVSTISEALDKIMNAESFSASLRDVETDRAISSAINAGSTKLPEFLEWLSQPEQSVHAAPTRKTILDCVELFPDIFDSLLRLSNRLRPTTQRFELLLDFLGVALSREDGADIEKTVDAIDQLLASGSTTSLEAWANYCLENPAFRRYLTEFAADTEGIAGLLKAELRDEAKDALCSAIYRARPVNNAVDYARLNVFLSELRNLDPELAQLFEEESLSQPPSSYVPWHMPTDIETEITHQEPVRIIFVGGTHEEQGKLQSQVDQQLKEKFGSLVEVRYFHPGWGSNWSNKADQIESHFADSDALVLMPLVRTNFGRRIRKNSGLQNTPWIPCTGKGVGSIVKSISEAVNISNSLRLRHTS
jgi:hypothetical protein